MTCLSTINITNVQQVSPGIWFHRPTCGGAFHAIAMLDDCAAAQGPRPRENGIPNRVRWRSVAIEVAKKLWLHNYVFNAGYKGLQNHSEIDIYNL